VSRTALPTVSANDSPHPIHRAAGVMPAPDERLVVTARTRPHGRLDERLGATPADPSIAELSAIAQRASGSTLWLSGGEPTLRADLPELIAALAAPGRELGLASDALALAGEGACEALKSAGLGRLRATVHSARADAHDWLGEARGSLKRALRALSIARGLDLAIELQATVTRPTMAHLVELVELTARLGARQLHLRRLTARGAAAAELVMLMPRLSQIEPLLARAMVVAEGLGVELALHGFPWCAARRAEGCRASAPSWLVADGAAWQALAQELGEAPTNGACAGCPGTPLCAGAPADYVARFGSNEFRSEDASAAKRALVTAGAEPEASVTPPVPRWGRSPSTRSRHVRAQARLPAHGDPLAERALRHHAEVLRVRFGAQARVSCATCGDGPEPGPPEPTRLIRLRLVRAAQEGARTLRVASAASLAHPSAAELLRETTLLAFERVEICGEGSALGAMSDAACYPLAPLARVDVALYGPDAEEHDAHMGAPGALADTLAGLERVARVAGCAVGSFAVLHDEHQVAAYARAWQLGTLPGAPAFRLSPRGGSLAALAAAARGLPERASALALARVLPRCLFAPEGAEPAAPSSEGGGVHFGDGVDPSVLPSGSDIHGMFRPCVCGPELERHCPGLALGWSADVEGERS
jgi:hypothetical protein